MTILAQGPNWTEVLNTVGSTAVVLLILGFVGRSLFTTWLDRNLENHKNELARQSERELEQFRLLLRIEEMRQSRLLAQQARIIAKVYARLESVDQTLTQLATPLYHTDRNLDELKVKAIDAFNAFGEYYFARGIWLDHDTCNVINELHARLHKLLISFNYNVDGKGGIANRAAWVESLTAVKEEIPKARQLLDIRFRSLLGVAK